MVNLVGPAELAEILQLSRSRVFQLLTQDDFPVPLAILRMGQVWDLEEIRAWADQTGRAVHELPESWPMAAEAAGSQAPRPGRYRRG